MHNEDPKRKEILPTYLKQKNKKNIYTLIKGQVGNTNDQVSSSAISI